MLTLCIHTSAMTPKAYLLRDGAPLGHDDGDAPPNDPAAGPPLQDIVSDALAAAGAAARDIARIVVDIGPGRLGAVRAGVSFANGLALGLGAPLASVLATEALGRQAERAHGLPAVVAHKAAAGAAYVGRYNAGRLESLKYGPAADLLAAAAQGLDRFALVGWPVDQVAGLTPDREIIDGGDGRIAPETLASFAATADFSFGPAAPINEQSALIDG